jgi:hypothetical protein
MFLRSKSENFYIFASIHSYFPESGKNFPASGMRKIDFSHKITPRKVFFLIFYPVIKDTPFNNINGQHPIYYSMRATLFVRPCHKQRLRASFMCENFRKDPEKLHFLTIFLGVLKIFDFLHSTLIHFSRNFVINRIPQLLLWPEMIRRRRRSPRQIFVIDESSRKIGKDRAVLLSGFSLLFRWWYYLLWLMNSLAPSTSGTASAGS